MVVIGGEGDPQLAVAESIGRELEAGGVSVLVDDRDMGPGARFADAELIGAPARITVGKRTAEGGPVDVQVRRGREQTSVPVAELAAAVARALDWGGIPGQERDEARERPVLPGAGADDAGRGGLLPRARGKDRPLGRLPEPPRPREPARPVGRGDPADREGAGREA